MHFCIVVFPVLFCLHGCCLLFLECQKTQVADVVFLVDASTSIAPADFTKMKVFMNSVVSSAQVGKDNVRFCAILYSTKPEAKFQLDRYYTKRELESAINNLTSPNGDTYTGKALQYSLDYFSQAKGGRAEKGVPQMLFVITDGEATDPHDLSKPADELQARRVSVYGIAVAKAAESEDLAKEIEIITKDKKKVYKVDDFEALKTLQQNISSVLCNKSKPGKSITSAFILTQTFKLFPFGTAL